MTKNLGDNFVDLFLLHTFNTEEANMTTEYRGLKMHQFIDSNATIEKFIDKYISCINSILTPNVCEA